MVNPAFCSTVSNALVGVMGSDNSQIATTTAFIGSAHTSEMESPVWGEWPMYKLEKFSLVAANLSLEYEPFQWDVRFIRAAHDWEVDDLASFFALLYSIRIERNAEDKLWWSPSRKGKFDVSSFYKTLVYKESACFPWKSIWRTKAPSKVAFFRMDGSAREDSYFGQS
jgi:hypothetical protein